MVLKMKSKYILCLSLFISTIVSAQTLSPKDYADYGKEYELGRKYPQDFGKAIEYYKYAAQGGYDPAMERIGFFYMQGVGVNKNYEEAISWLTKASNLGSAPAEYNLGLIYADEKGEYYDPVESFNWMMKSATKNLPAALAAVGLKMYRGFGTESNPKESVKWFKAAADRKAPLGQLMIGIMIKEGQISSKDKNESSMWINLALNQKMLPDDFYAIGMMYSKGDGLPLKPSESVYWMAYALQNGYSSAAYFLQSAFANGFGVRQSKTLSMAMYEFGKRLVKPNPQQTKLYTDLVTASTTQEKLLAVSQYNDLLKPNGVLNAVLPEIRRVK